ncbi:hypothetical protein H4R35_006971, partial [Dimargaris xerosporica]
MLFVDQPFGTGWSKAESFAKVPLVDTSAAAAQDMLQFLYRFYEVFPQYRHLDFHIFGQSYAGKYIPALATAIVRANQELQASVRFDTSRHYINLSSIGIGNGWINPLLQTHISEDDLPPNVCPDIQTTIPQCVALLTACYETQKTEICTMALEYCELKIRQVYAKTNFSLYDYERYVTFPNEEFEDPTLIEYLNRPDVRHATGAHVSAFQHCNPDINNAFIASGDFLLDATPQLEYLLSQGVDTLLYAGERDVACSWAGVYEVAMALDWPEAANFRKATAYPLIVNSRVKGVIRRHGSLALVRVLDAGHM